MAVKLINILSRLSSSRLILRRRRYSWRSHRKQRQKLRLRFSRRPMQVIPFFRDRSLFLRQWRHPVKSVAVVTVAAVFQRRHGTVQCQLREIKTARRQNLLVSRRESRASGTVSAADHERIDHEAVLETVVVRSPLVEFVS